jgi:hypothetical protein
VRGRAVEGRWAAEHVAVRHAQRLAVLGVEHHLPACGG